MTVSPRVSASEEELRLPPKKADVPMPDDPFTAMIEQLKNALDTSDIKQEALPRISATGSRLLDDVKTASADVGSFLKADDKGLLLTEIAEHLRRAMSATDVNAPSGSGGLIPALFRISDDDAKQAGEEGKEGVMNFISTLRLVITKKEFRDLFSRFFNTAMLIIQEQVLGQHLSSEQSKDPLESVGEAAETLVDRSGEQVKETVSDMASQAKDVVSTETPEKPEDKTSSFLQDSSQSEPSQTEDRHQKDPQISVVDIRERLFSSQEHGGDSEDRQTMLDRRNQMLSDLLDATFEIQKIPEYQRAVSYFISAAKRIYSLVKYQGESLTDEVRRELSESKEAIRKDESPTEARSKIPATPTSAVQEEYLALLKTQKLVEACAKKPLDDLLKVSSDLGDILNRKTQEREYFQRLSDFVQKTLRDPEHLKQVQAVVRKRMKDQGPEMPTSDDTTDKSDTSMIDERVKEELDSLFGEKSPLFESDVKATVKTLRQEFVQLFNALSSQPEPQRISKDIQKLVNDLLYDSTGQPAFKPELLADLSVILPILINRIKEFDLDDLKTSDEDIDFMLEDVKLKTNELMPSMFKIKAKSQMKINKASADVKEGKETLPVQVTSMTTMDVPVEEFEQYSRDHQGKEPVMLEEAHLVPSTSQTSLPAQTELHSHSVPASEVPPVWTTDIDNSIKIKISHLKFWADNMAFYYRKKSGFPKLSDSGRASLKIHGDRGLSLVIKISPLVPPRETVLVSSKHTTETADVPPHKSYFKIDKVIADIDRISISISESQHQILYKLLAPWLKSYIRDKLIAAIEDQTAKILYEADLALANFVESTKDKASESSEMFKSILPTESDLPSIIKSVLTDSPPH